MYLYYLTIGRFYVRVLYFLISKLCSPIIRFWRFIKNGLTRIINHFKIKLTVFYTKRKEKGEREHAESLRKSRTGRRPAFRRRKNENRLGMSMAFLAIVMIVAVVGINSISLKQKQAKYIAREQELQQQIDAETARSEQLKELETYTKTKKYAEEVAKDKLGLVYDNEIIFKEEE